MIVASYQKIETLYLRWTYHEKFCFPMMNIIIPFTIKLWSLKLSILDGHSVTYGMPTSHKRKTLSIIWSLLGCICFGNILGCFSNPSKQVVKIV
jgi:hypothetical protein